MPKIDVALVPEKGGTGYPVHLSVITQGRFRKRLGDAGGLTQFGVNLCRLEPGSGSSLRHWHHNEDEFVYILEGEATLIDDDGETVLKPGDAATFKAGAANGHHTEQMPMSCFLKSAHAPKTRLSNIPTLICWLLPQTASGNSPARTVQIFDE
jgi:uncharacterized cupin superfamily protein